MVTTLAGVELEPLTSSADAEDCRFEFNQETTAASMAVIAALSEVSETDPLAMTPLREAIDTEALDSLVSERDDDIQITFSVESYTVTVRSDGVVDVTSPVVQQSGTGPQT